MHLAGGALRSESLLQMPEQVRHSSLGLGKNIFVFLSGRNCLGNMEIKSKMTEQIGHGVGVSGQEWVIEPRGQICGRGDNRFLGEEMASFPLLLP